MPWNGFNFREVYTPKNYPDTEYDMTDGSKMTVKQAIEQGEEIVKKIKTLDLLDIDMDKKHIIGTKY